MEPRSPVQTHSTHLYDGEAKGLLQGDVGEDAARGGGKFVDVGDVGLGVMLWVRHAAEKGGMVLGGGERARDPSRG